MAHYDDGRVSNIVRHEDPSGTRGISAWKAHIQSFNAVCELQWIRRWERIDMGRLYIDHDQQEAQETDSREEGIAYELHLGPALFVWPRDLIAFSEHVNSHLMKKRAPAAKPLTRLRKRPKQLRSTVTFDAILDAAARILVDHGQTHLTTNIVAARAGVSVGSVYQYFPNKQAIVHALMKREVAKAQAQRPRILDDPKCPLETRVRALIDWRCDLRLREPILQDELHKLASQLLSDQERKQFDAVRRERTISGIGAWLADQPNRNPDEVGAIVDAVLVALSDRANLEGLSRLRSETFRREIKELLLRYLSVPVQANSRSPSKAKQRLPQRSLS